MPLKRRRLDRLHRLWLVKRRLSLVRLVFQHRNRQLCSMPLRLSRTGPFLLLSRCGRRSVEALFSLRSRTVLDIR
jgi:hypothetical protein